MKKVFTLIGLLALSGCALSKVTISTTSGTNKVDIISRDYSIWPATANIDKRKVSATKTTAGIGLEGQTLEGGGTNMAAAITGLVELVKQLK